MKSDTHKFIQDILDFVQHPLFHLGTTEVTLLSLFVFICVIILVFILESLFRRYMTRRFLKQTHLNTSMQYAVGKIAGYVFIAIGVCIAFKIVGIDFSSLALIAGSIGVGLGFGLQNIVSNFFSGLIILAEQPIAIGDRVELGGITGIVAKINLRSTNIVTNDNITIIVPNSDIITNKVTNWSYGDPKVRIRLPIGVAYGTDPARLTQLLLEVAHEHSAVLKDPAPQVFFIEFGDSSLNFELGVWTIDMTAKPRVFRSELNFALERKLRENKIEVPFPQRDLHLRSGNFVLTTPPADTKPSLPK